MSDEDTKEGFKAKSRAELLSELDQLQEELRRRLLALVEHPGISEELKNDPNVREWLK